jgi:hypothetical protein
MRQLAHLFDQLEQPLSPALQFLQRSRGAPEFGGPPLLRDDRLLELALRAQLESKSVQEVSKHRN